MSGTPAGGTRGACADCLRRSWLIAELGATLEFASRDRARLLALLALEDERLIAAAAGRRAPELRRRYGAFGPSRREERPGEEALCRHDPRYPRALGSAAAPAVVHLTGGAARLARLTAAPTVLVSGSAKASDYGREAARSLARGLAAAGVTVLALNPSCGIARAALHGALEAGGPALAVIGCGLAAASGTLRVELESLGDLGCAISELPRACGGRRWGQLASERIAAELASLTVLVEAREDSGELATARLAAAFGRALAAIPGRINSPLAAGGNLLLREGARLLRGPGDALELLYELAGETPRAPTRSACEPELETRLRETLELVGMGLDTPDRLTASGVRAARVLSALGELELMGLLVRGEGGRYLPATPATGRPRHACTAPGARVVRN